MDLWITFTWKKKFSMTICHKISIFPCIYMRPTWVPPWFHHFHFSDQGFWKLETKTTWTMWPLIVYGNIQVHKLCWTQPKQTILQFGEIVSLSLFFDLPTGHFIHLMKKSSKVSVIVSHWPCLRAHGTHQLASYILIWLCKLYDSLYQCQHWSNIFTLTKGKVSGGQSNCLQIQLVPSSIPRIIACIPISFN